MIIYFNNMAMDVKVNSTIEEVLKIHGSIEHMAVWKNGDHIILSEFKNIKLNVSDHLKVIRIRGGG